MKQYLSRYSALASTLVLLCAWALVSFNSKGNAQSPPISAAGIGGNPPGTVVAFAGKKAPAGYMLCDGRAVSRITYAGLFSAIGINNGVGDGIKTFNLPDYRGMFLRGVDGGTGRDPDAATRTSLGTGGNTGINVGSVQWDALQGHRHVDSGHNHNVTAGFSIFLGGGSDYGGGAATGPGTAIIFTSSAASANIGDPVANNNGTPRLSNETRPINASVLYIIKY